MFFVAHRGESYDAPENTLAAFNLAWKRGGKAIECDFRLTKDGKIVCIHDESTKRTCGTDLKIAETDSDVLRELDAGSWKDLQFKGEKIPFLEEVLGTMRERGLIFAELKTGPEIVGAFKQVIDSMDFPCSRIRFISFYPETLREAKKLMPKIKSFLLVSEIPEDPGVFIKNIREACAGGADIQAEKVTEDIVDELHSENMEAHTWTVDELPMAEKLICVGIGSVTSNRPSFLKSELGL